MAKESAYLTLKHVSGSHEIKEIKKELGALHGVLSVSVNAESDMIAVDYDDTGLQDRKIISRTLGKLGYEVKSERTEKHVM